MKVDSIPRDLDPRVSPAILRGDRQEQSVPLMVYADIRCIGHAVCVTYIHVIYIRTRVYVYVYYGRDDKSV